MKDFVPKGTGNSRFLKSVSNFLSLYPSYEDFVAALVAGTLPIDLNGINAEGVTQVGTGLTKANFLTDATATALELSQADPTVNDALYALSQKTQPAMLNIHTNSGVVVRATKGSKVLSATANSSGLAVLYPDEFGTWTLSATISGKTLTVPFEIDAIAVFDFVMTTNLETASWALIHAVSEAGNAASVWSVGDKKTVNIGGVNYQAQIIGFNHDTKTAGGKAGITFQLVDCLNSTEQMETSNTNANGWEGCKMRKTTLPNILTQLPEDLQTCIVPVNKVSSVGNNSSSLETTSDKLFLLSEIEIFGATTYSFAGEGTQYAWYAAGNTKVKKVNGSANYWWGRSPRSGGTTYFCGVYSNGVAYSGDANGSYGVSFGFCV